MPTFEWWGPFALRMPCNAIAPAVASGAYRFPNRRICFQKVQMSGLCVSCSLQICALDWHHFSCPSVLARLWRTPWQNPRNASNLTIRNHEMPIKNQEKGYVYVRYKLSWNHVSCGFEINLFFWYPNTLPKHRSPPTKTHPETLTYLHGHGWWALDRTLVSSKVW